MILIGQYDLPFVRRVAIAMRLYGMAYEHRPWSTFGDGEKIAAYNPLRRVPTLVLDDGEVLIESAAILDALDGMVGLHRALIAPDGAARRKALKICALATGLGDKGVALLYERILHETISPVWVERCRGQIVAVLDALEADRAGQAGRFWTGDRIGHADIAAGAALCFTAEAHPDLWHDGRWPALAAHLAQCETLEVFSTIYQKLIPPGPRPAEA